MALIRPVRDQQTDQQRQGNEDKKRKQKRDGVKDGKDIQSLN
jgi:hypothetical protein